MYVREFPGGPVVRTQRFYCRGPGSTPGGGTKIPQAEWRGQKQTKNVCEAETAGCLTPPYPCAEASEGENSVMGFSLRLEPFLVIASLTLQTFPAHLP